VTRLVVGFAGRSKSGKTRLSTKLAAEVEGGLASFGNLVRDLARHRRLDPDDPRVLLSVGSTLIENECDFFCRAALSAGGWPNVETVILDGIRHMKVVNVIKAVIAPAKFRLVMITASPQSRLSRFRQADSARTITLEEIDAHPISAETQALGEAADFIADGDQPDSQAVEHLAKLVNHWRITGGEAHL
jgi:dephospho-CoA kinase